jgi:hypothetical protein
VVLLGGFVLAERRVRHPLLPLRVIVDRARGGSYVALGISGIAIFGTFADTGDSAIRASAQRVMEVVLDHIKVLERTGLVRYAALSLPARPTAASGPNVPSEFLRYQVGSMLLAAAAVTVVARRDLIHRGV